MKEACMCADGVKEFYDKQYKLYGSEGTLALHDLRKACRRLKGVLFAFGLGRKLNGANVLDLGCGLGYYTKAFSQVGANVVGIDFSKEAVKVARQSFPGCKFECGSWPEDVLRAPEYDLIWAVNFSLINTFDVRAIHDRLISEALDRLRPGGSMIIGWNSNFSGKMLGSYSMWSVYTLRTMQRECGLSSPIVAEARSKVLSWAFIRLGRALKRTVPIFMIRTKR